MESISSFGEMLKTLRTRKHLTQQNLAALMGVHRNTISIWERGDYLPESKTLVLEVAHQLGLAEQETRHLLEASLTALPPYWHVPFPHNPFFTGREEILEALHTYLHADQMVALTQSYALHGLGGVGKTQIALEYAYRHALEYSAVFWIGAETSESITSSLLRVAEVLQLPEREDRDQQRAVAAVQHWLVTHRRWLLIWDNVEDLALLDHFLPSARAGAILLTTRCQALGTLARGIDLLPMGQEEGVLFLLRRAKVLDPQASGEQVRQFVLQMPALYASAIDLVTAMGGLPLALDQTGAYLEATQCGLSVYLDLFRIRRASLLKLRGARACGHPEPVSTTLILSVATTAQYHPAVYDLLRVCALLQPDTIPEELFRQGAEHLGAQLRAVCGDELEWNQVVALACAYSLLHRQAEEQTLSLHRLVQAVLLDTMTETEREQWSRRVVEALDTVFPDVEQAKKYAIWRQCERLLSHALLCLQQTAASENFLALASLAYKVAQYLCEQGRYAEAEAHYLRALHIFEQALGPDHILVAESLNGLANLYRDQNQYAEAEALFQRALSIRERHLGQCHPETAETLYALALLRKIQDKLKDARSFAERALQIRSQTLGFGHPKTVATQALYVHLLQEQATAKKKVSEQDVKEIADDCSEKRQAGKMLLPLHKGGDPSSSANDPLQGFLDAYCELHPRAWCRSVHLWQAYEHWVEEYQERYPLSRRAFIAQLKAHGCRADRTMTARIWRGIAIVKKNL